MSDFAQYRLIDKLEAENAALRAARIAYAREFPLNEEGEPDVGNIHANIRKLKAENAALRADAEQLDWLEQHDGRFYNIDRITAIVGNGFNGGQKSLRAAIAKLKDQQ